MIAPTTNKKVLLLGAGYVAGPCAKYLVEQEYQLTIASLHIKDAQTLCSAVDAYAAEAVDISSSTALDSLIARHQLVISLLPYTCHPTVIKSACRAGVNVITTSYVTPELRSLDPLVKEAGILVMNEVGLDPGIDHISCIPFFDAVHKDGGKILEYSSFCGGLPSWDCSDNPINYRFSWSAKGVLLALGNSAKYLKDGSVVEVEGKNLMSSGTPYVFNKKRTLVGFPNRDSTPYAKNYGIPEAASIIRGTLRHAGFESMVECFREVGLLNVESVALFESKDITWLELMAELVGCETDKKAVIAKLNQLQSFQTDLYPSALCRMETLGMLSSTNVDCRGTALDTLCGLLERECSYGPGQRDMVLLQHRYVVERKDKSVEVHKSTLEAYGDLKGYSAMARLVGIPCAIAATAVLEGDIVKTGVHTPYDIETCNLLGEKLKECGITFVDEVES